MIVQVVLECWTIVLCRSWHVQCLGKSQHCFWLVKKKQRAESCFFWPITNYSL